MDLVASYEHFLCGLVTQYKLRDTYSNSTLSSFTEFISHVESHFKAREHCLVCCLPNIKDRKHLTTYSHRRKMACVELKLLLGLCQTTPRIESWLRLKDLLSTPRHPRGRLLDLQLSYWSDKNNAGIKHGGQGLDASKQWFIGFISEVETLFRSPQNPSITGVIDEIRDVIIELRQPQPQPRVAQVYRLSHSLRGD
jgi:hypothetical protein